MDDNARLLDLQRRRDECLRACEILTQEITAIEDFKREEKIRNVTLDPNAKLIDLLRIRVLDPSEDWKSKIDTLIAIPTSMKGPGLNGGDYFEALFQLAISIGILPQFREYRSIMHDIDKYKDLREYENYLHRKPIQNKGGRETGISDITFELVKPGDVPKPVVVTPPARCGEVQAPIPAGKEGRTFYFISVKGYRREKSIKDDYDIPLLSEQLREFPEIANKHIVVCVRNKADFMRRLGRSRIEFLKHTIDHVIGYDEVIDAFSTLRTNFFLKLEAGGSIDEEVLRRFPPDPEKGYKPILSLYFHQELVVKAVTQRIVATPSPDRPYFMCIGVLPRGGKSYIAGGIIDAHRRLVRRDTYNVLFLTSAVNETREQFSDDLVNKFAEFGDMKFIDFVNDKKAKLANVNFIFVSRQLSSLSETTGKRKKKKEEGEGTEVSILSEDDIITRLQETLGELRIDLCFFDEAHVGIGAKPVRDQFQRVFERFKIPIIMMTATYRKPAVLLDDPRDLFVWDLQDIQEMKDLPTLKLDGFLEKNPGVLQRYPDLAREILTHRIRLGQTESDIAKPYIDFPTPNFISLTFAPETIKELKDTGTGYDYMKAFQINSNPELLKDSDRFMEWGTLLVNRPDAMNIRQFLTPEQDPDDTFLVKTDRKYRAFNQIFAIAQRTGSRPVIGRPFSVMMFLPFGEGLPIGELCRIWGSFLLESRYWRDNFVVLTLSTYSGHVKNPKMTPALAVSRGLCHRDDFPSLALKDLIQTIEREALKVGKGLILLSGDVAKMGISLKCVDVVCLMSNTEDPDDIIQKMYRALTDDPPMKKNGYIIDLNLKRIVRAMFDYDMEKSRRTQTITGKTDTPKERIQRIMELCNWGQDAFMIDNAGMSFDDVMNEIRQRVFSTIESRIRLEYGTRDLVDKQFSVIQRDKELFGKVQDILKFTTGKRPKSSAKETLLERGADVPEAEQAEGEEGKEEKEKPKPKEAPPAVEPLSPEQIKKKIVDIMITFVNALVIKSDQPWNDIKFESLLDKYISDKASATRVCSCEETQSCGSAFSNLYDIVYCELRGYAMLETKTGEVVYDPETHKRIMDLMDELFAASSSLSPDWTNYIVSLIEDISKKSQTGGALDKTERINSILIDNNVRRKTKRNHSRDNRETSDTRRAGKKGTG